MTVKGIYKDGIIRPIEKAHFEDNQEVFIITNDIEASKKEIYKNIKAEYAYYMVKKSDSFIEEDQRLNMIANEMEYSSRYLDEKWKDQNKNKIHSPEDIDANCF
ncbi:MAG: hypothetical protein GY760_24015 [Deltaproteobacteria bacterium]|nr:hypothetical protein [Deltaproteobacteria bacterium]